MAENPIPVRPSAAGPEPAPEMLVLYILARTDLASMTRGMFGAHAAHAQSHAQFYIQNMKSFGAEWVEAYERWQKETGEGFGTVLTLDAGGIVSLRGLVTEAREMGFPAGVTRDPTYPLLDGSVVHLIPLDTCGWIFADKASVTPVLGGLNLLS